MVVNKDGMVSSKEEITMSQLSYIYSEFKKDNFQPKMQAICFAPNDDMSVFMHPEVPELIWFAQFQKRNGLRINPYWSLTGGWVLI